MWRMLSSGCAPLSIDQAQRARRRVHCYYQRQRQTELWSPARCQGSRSGSRSHSGLYHGVSRNLAQCRRLGVLRATGHRVRLGYIVHDHRAGDCPTCHSLTRSEHSQLPHQRGLLEAAPHPGQAVRLPTARTPSSAPPHAPRSPRPFLACCASSPTLALDAPSCRSRHIR